MPHVLVWDIETVPDLAGFAAANGHDGKTDDEIRAELGDKFPKHIYHSIICIGALIAHQQDDHWVVDALGAPHVGDRSERDLIAAFVEKIAELKPQLVTFNGAFFDLPVVRYRAMVHKVSAAGLSARPYFHRYTDDAVDLCDVLPSFAPGAKAGLHELCRVMGLPGRRLNVSRRVAVLSAGVSPANNARVPVKLKPWGTKKILASLLVSAGEASADTSLNGRDTAGTSQA
jgi:predicted PolB exonuclease-like 3'-5' exonuclease